MLHGELLLHCLVLLLSSELVLLLLLLGGHLQLHLLHLQVLWQLHTLRNHSGIPVLLQSL